MLLFAVDPTTLKFCFNKICSFFIWQEKKKKSLSDMEPKDLDMVGKVESAWAYFWLSLVDS